MNALMSYQFEEAPVRVVMMAGDPWFVANDVAKVLGYRDAPNMVRNLDDDEKGTHIVSTLGGDQEMNIISESGVYAAIFKSRRAEAQRFRKWVTGEVLPELRRTGQYKLRENEPPPPLTTDYDPTRLSASVAVVREALRLFGPKTARSVWVQLGLPVSIAEAQGAHEGDPLAAPLKNWLADQRECTIAEAAQGIGVAELDTSTRYRIGALLRIFGWSPRKARRGIETVNLFTPAFAQEG